MDITIYPRKLCGSLQIIPSKSQAHRLLICAAFADEPTTLICPATNQDIEATASCLNALGAKITRTCDGYHIEPLSQVPEQAYLNCKESGSTLRFMLPIAGALGIDTTFLMEGRLPSRPLSPLWEELERMGCSLSRPDKNAIRCTGRLQPGSYSIDGGISSQFVTGLLFALAILPGKSSLTVTGNMESVHYIRMTEQALALFGIDTSDYNFYGSPFLSPGTIEVEGDWSNGAFFLGANALGSNIELQGLQQNSTQGDRAAEQLMHLLKDPITVSGKDIPDLIPILAVVAGAKKGAIFEDIGRLRLKESDRVASVSAMLQAFGAEVSTSETSMKVLPAVYKGCTVDSQNDHRIAMAAAIAATVSHGPVTILNAHCVNKSYPDFWSEFERLGGCYEQHIR